MKKPAPARSLAHRLKCVRLVLKGASAAEVARWSGDSFGIVARWVRMYREHGAEGLEPRPHTGRRSRLSGEQIASLRRFVAARPEGVSGPEAAAFIKKSFRISLSPRQAQRVLGRL